MSLLRPKGRPRLVKLPDRRLRIIRLYEVRGDAADPASLDTVFLPWGTPDVKYTQCLLIEQPQLDFAPDQGVEHDLARVYEEIHPTDETQVGKLREIIGEDGRDYLEAQFIQFSTGPRTEGVRGITTPPGRTDAVMSSETCDNDGTLRRITRRYAIASDAVEPLIDGANETGRGDDVWQDEDNRHRRRRTFIQKATVTYNEPVAGTHLITVEGVHYVNTGEQRGGGAAVRTITREFQEATAEWTQVGPAIPATAADGLKTIQIVQVRIGYITGGDVPTVGTSTTPDGGTDLKLFRISGEGSSVAISRRVLTYKQPGILRTSDNVRNNGKLTLRGITAFCMIPPTPEGFVAVDQGVDDPGGAPTRTYQFARGEGLISRDLDTGVTGGLRAYNTRYLSPYVAPAEGAQPQNPTPMPMAGALKASESWSDSDGYVVWSTRWIVGGKIELTEDEDGRKTLEATYLYFVTPDNDDFPAVGDACEPIIDTDTEGEEGEGAATAPDGSPHLAESERFVYAGRREGSAYGYKTVTLRFQEATAEWTQVGPTISDWEMNGLERMIVRLVAKGGTALPEADDITIGYSTIDGESAELTLGGVSRAGSNHAIARLTLTYLQPGLVRRRTRQLPSIGGLRELLIETFLWGRDEVNASGIADAADGDIPGILISDDTDNVQGYPMRQLRWMQTANGGDPTDGMAQEFTDMVQFTYPGRARPYFFKRQFGLKAGDTIDPLPGGGLVIQKMPIHYDFNVMTSPPVQIMVKATVSIRYSESPDMEDNPEAPLWNPDNWAIQQLSYLSSGDSPVHEITHLKGYRVYTDAEMAGEGDPGDGGIHWGGNGDITGGGPSPQPSTVPIAVIDGRTSAFDPEYRGHNTWSLGNSFGLWDSLGYRTGPVIIVSGGPPAPDNKKWTLSSKPEPAFVGEDGKQYWRHTVVTSEIPKQTPIFPLGDDAKPPGEIG
ncbi:hypothetical protein [Geminisphaera colitermitum]|uniref:hypothetical protein n=1 Tax=Geminisphaera colitermitum TaxID=1148786 RepID=UPI000158C827|nr:hypothetical protein [Geminisphaera colitermitum]